MPLERVPAEKGCRRAACTAAGCYRLARRPGREPQFTGPAPSLPHL